MMFDARKDTAWLSDLSPTELRRIVDGLYRVHHLIAAITDLNELLERIVDESKRIACAEGSSLMLYDPDAEELFFHVTLGESGDLQALKCQVRLKLGQGIAGTAAANREIINVDDPDRDPRFFKDADSITHFETRSLLAVPLVDRENLVGVLELVNKVGGAGFSETDVRLMEMFSSLAATAIANANLIAENVRAERLAAIGQAVASLSHYTKNLLTTVTGSAQLVEEGLETNNLSLLRGGWPILRRCTERMSYFVGDMLAFSKPRVPNLTPCSIDNVLTDAEATFRSMMAQKDVSIEVDSSLVNGPVQVDPDALFRGLLNILLNAGEAVAAETGAIRVVAETLEDGALRIDVSDNGPGIPEGLEEKVFAPFFSTKGSKGTGLGLAVAAKIVAEHGGRITASKASEGGALFRITLPQGGAA